MCLHRLTTETVPRAGARGLTSLLPVDTAGSRRRCQPVDSGRHAQDRSSLLAVRNTVCNLPASCARRRATAVDRSRVGAGPSGFETVCQLRTVSIRCGLPGRPELLPQPRTRVSRTVSRELRRRWHPKPAPATRWVRRSGVGEPGHQTRSWNPAGSNLTGLHRRATLLHASRSMVRLAVIELLDHGRLVGSHRRRPTLGGSSVPPLLYGSSADDLPD